MYTSRSEMFVWLTPNSVTERCPMLSIPVAEGTVMAVPKGVESSASGRVSAGCCSPCTSEW